MSKKKHRRRRDNDNSAVTNNNNNNIMDMLNNIDQEQLQDLLANLNLGNLGSLGSMDNMAEAVNSVAANNSTVNNNDETLQLLYAIKPMVNAEKGAILDRIIQLYSIGRMLTKK